MFFWNRSFILVSMIWFLPAAALAQERPYDWGWGMHPMGWMGGMWGLGIYDARLLGARHYGRCARRSLAIEPR